MSDATDFKALLKRAEEGQEVVSRLQESEENPDKLDALSSAYEGFRQAEVAARKIIG